MRKATHHQISADLTGAEPPEWARPLLLASAMVGRDDEDDEDDDAENQLAAARVRRPQSTMIRADVAHRIAGQHPKKRAHIPKRATSHTERNLSAPQTQQPSQQQCLQSICTACESAGPEHADSMGAISWAPPSPLRANADNNNGGGNLFEQDKKQVAAPVAGSQNWDSPRRSARAISWRRRAQPVQRTRTCSRLTPGQISAPSSTASAAFLIFGLLFCFTFCSCRPGASVQCSGLTPSSSSSSSSPASAEEAADKLTATPLQQEPPTRLKRQLEQDGPNKKHRHNQHHNHNNRRNTKRATAASDDQLKLSHHVRCEPISQVNNLELACPHPNQFIVILEAYYSDRYPELACPRALDSESKLNGLSSGQLVDIFRQLYAPKSPAAVAGQQQPAGPIRWMPTLSTTLEPGRQASAPFCLDFDLKLSIQAKCSGRRECRFSRADHQFPACVQLKPGHVFLRHLCVDEAILVRHCNANDLLASSGPLDFGFVMSPGYPNFYVMPQASDASAGCSWRIGAQPGQRVTVKLLDASLAPNHFVGWPSTSPEWFESAPSATGDLPTVSDLANHFRSLYKQSTQERIPTHSTNILLEQLTGTPNNTAGLNQETLSLLNSLNVRVHDKRIVFKIDQHDYHVIKLNLALKLEQISNRCLNYDQLVVRDLIDQLKNTPQPLEEASSRALDSATLPASAIDMTSQDERQWPVGDAHKSLFEAATTMKSIESFDNEQELELISKLPVSLYRNHLIDFRNETIFHSGTNPASNPKRVGRHYQTQSSERFINQQQEAPRLDYKALLEGLNPLQLAWLYQHNVTLCSMSQLEQVSALQERQKVSFTSSANLIQLDLVAGRVFNPTNRGLLFWFHKHGCPQTRTWPKRSRLIFRNETLEVFKCLDGFVFSDTRQIVRQRECNQRTQLWFDRAIEQNPFQAPHKQQQDQMPACVFVEDLVQADNSLTEGTSLTSKFERLIAATLPSTDAQATQRQATLKHNPEGGRRREVATEIVGTPQNKSLDPLDFDLFNSEEHSTNQMDTGRSQPATDSGGPMKGLLRSLLDFIRDRSQTNGHQSANHTSQLMNQRQGGSSQARWSFDLDRHLLLAVLLILSLFVLLNLIIYVIFLVAIPSVIRCLFCPNLENNPRGKTSRNSRQLVRRSPSTCKLTATMNGSNKLAHYESDYSVTMGMSL